MRQRAAHAPAAAPGATREPIQLGAELFGDAGVEADVEVRSCCARAELAARATRASTSATSAVFRAIAQPAGLGDEAELFEALQTKDVPALRELTRKLPADA